MTLLLLIILITQCVDGLSLAANHEQEGNESSMGRGEKIPNSELNFMMLSGNIPFVPDSNKSDDNVRNESLFYSFSKNYTSNSIEYPITEGDTFLHNASLINRLNMKTRSRCRRNNRKRTCKGCRMNRCPSIRVPKPPSHYAAMLTSLTLANSAHNAQSHNSLREGSPNYNQTWPFPVPTWPPHSTFSSQKDDLQDSVIPRMRPCTHGDCVCRPCKRVCKFTNEFCDLRGVCVGVPCQCPKGLCAIN